MESVWRNASGLVEHDANDVFGGMGSRDKVSNPTIEGCNASTMPESHREHMSVRDLAVTV